jgi:hypothetical protein
MRNSHGDIIEVHSDGTRLNLNYWECMCAADYVHHLGCTVCVECNLNINDGASARDADVIREKNNENSTLYNG